MAPRKLMLNEKYYALFLEKEIAVYDDKHGEAIRYPGGPGYDLFKLKNSSYLAYVETKDNNTYAPAGTTLLINERTLAEVIHIPVPLSQKSTRLDNEMLIGLYGKSFYYFNLETYLNHSFSAMRYDYQDCVAIGSNAFALVEGNVSNIFYLPNGELHANYRFQLKDVEKFVALKGNLFLTQMKSDSKLIFRIYNIESFQVELSKELPYFIDFKKLLLMPDQETILGLTIDGKIYYLYSTDLSLEKMDFEISKAEDILLTEENRLFARIEDD
ncbi:MAG TPA: hypothetical protein VHM20_07355, partial [Gammaproteobacteria bacterium]|nr:hypothetical protein [Gammaproteobacteria bacterium]